MTAPILARNAPSRPALPVLGDVRLPLARLHEVCGPARHVLAMLVAAAMRGPVFWIAPAGRADGLNPEGMVPFTAPQRFTFVSPDRPEDVLWTLEETLRSGVVPLVVGDLPAPPPLTPVRRLHLAAEAGAAEGGQDMPLGLVLTPGDGGAPGVETRWHMAPAHAAQARRWTLERRRARTAPPRRWCLSGRPGNWRLTPDADMG